MPEVLRFPPSFHTEEIQTEGATIHVRVGGQGPAVVMLHGFGDTGDMWAPLAATLVHDHAVVVPDLRGMGLSSHPEDGYDKKTQGGDVAHVLDHLKIQGPILSPMISATWWAMPSPHNIQIGSVAGWRWTPRSRGSARGTRSFEAPPCGISISADRMSNVWSKAASAFTSTASGTSYQPTQNRS